MSKSQSSNSSNVQDLELNIPQRWTAKRKAALVIDLLQGNTIAAEAARWHALTLAEVEQWKDDFITRGTEALRSHPRDLARQFEAREETLLAKVGELTLHVDILKNLIAIKARPCRKGFANIEMAQLGWLSRCARFVVVMQNQLLQSGSPSVPVSMLCRLLGVARSTTYYQPRGRHLEPQCDPLFVEAIRAVIEAHPTYGVRMTHARLTKGLDMIVDRKKVHRIMKLHRWTCRQRRTDPPPHSASQIHRRDTQPTLAHRHCFCGLRARRLVRIRARHRLLLA